MDPDRCWEKAPVLLGLRCRKRHGHEGEHQAPDWFPYRADVVWDSLGPVGWSYAPWPERGYPEESS